ncbi:ribonuclease kappa-like isoform X1 [Teleopsis dalmanni]|uniref:ribonuclease kappa-like isoform X1 n=1 Tax=Teleopsis dalmanni TaxID=139649 RepID=UPI0018CF6577|nr:ribonuclease kappa-like isoform X1 [Teleopsis dalmanni]
MKICGPKLSLCGLLISIWGLVQLAFMGLFYYLQSVSLIQDLPLEEHYDTLEMFYDAASDAYYQNAYNCWVAAFIYLITLVLSIHQYRVNKKPPKFQPRKVSRGSMNKEIVRR